MCKFVKIILFTLVLTVANAQQSSIYQENIIFTLSHKYLMVNGFYYFANTPKSKDAVVMIFPLPKGAKESDIDSVSLKNYKTYKKLFYTIDSVGIKINFDFETSDTAIINLKFRHWVAGNFFSYSLKPIGNWDIKLRYADFTLFTSPNIKIDSLSIPPDFKAIQPDRKVFFWKRDNYLPETNFEVYFKK